VGSLRADPSGRTHSGRFGSPLASIGGDSVGGRRSEWRLSSDGVLVQRLSVEIVSLRLALTMWFALLEVRDLEPGN